MGQSVIRARPRGGSQVTLLEVVSVVTNQLEEVTHCQGLQQARTFQSIGSQNRLLFAQCAC